jgi:hypothetical protein
MCLLAGLPHPLLLELTTAPSRNPLNYLMFSLLPFFFLRFPPKKRMSSPKTT